MRLSFFYITLLVILGGLLLVSATLPLQGIAAEDTKLVVQFPGATSVNTNPGAYIKAIYQWSIGLAALLAMGMLVYGGVKYTLSAGSIGSREDAVSTIKNSLLGLAILLGIVLILTTINPNLAVLDLGRQNALLEAGQKRLAEVRSAQEKHISSYAEAAQAALGRLSGDYLDAYNSMIEELDEYLEDDVDDSPGEFEEFIGPRGGADDVFEYMELAAEEDDSGYRDAVIAALYYCMEKCNARDYQKMVSRIWTHPAFTELQQEYGEDTREYLRTDPFNRKNL